MVKIRGILGVLFGYISVVFIASILMKGEMTNYPWASLIQQSDLLSSMRAVVEFYPSFLAFHIIASLQNGLFKLEPILPYLIGGILGGSITDGWRPGALVGFFVGVVSFTVSLPLSTYELSVAYSIPILDAFFLSFPFTLFGSTLGGLLSLMTGFFGGILGSVVSGAPEHEGLEGVPEGEIPSPMIFDESPIICPYCGSVLPSDAIYCTNCGNKVR